MGATRSRRGSERTEPKMTSTRTEDRSISCRLAAEAADRAADTAFAAVSDPTLMPSARALAALTLDLLSEDE